MRADQLKQLLKNGVYRTIGEATTGAGVVNGADDRALCVLMYHKVNDTPANSVTVPVTLFDEQMAQLRELGYTAVSLDDVLAYYVDGVPLPPRAVLITFDDAYRDNLENAVPILVEHGYPAVLFAPIGYLDGSRPLPHDEHLGDARRPQPHAALERPGASSRPRASASSRTGSATARSPTSSWTRRRARSRSRSSGSRRRSAGRCARSRTSRARRRTTGSST